jgi:hypothetical protein
MLADFPQSQSHGQAAADHITKRDPENCFTLDFLMVLYYLGCQDRERETPFGSEHIITTEEIDQLVTANSFNQSSH